MKKILTYLICCLLPFMGASDTLWWFVNDTATIDNLPIVSFLENNFPEDDNHWIEARVIMTVNGERHIANIAYPDFPGERFESTYVGWSEGANQEWGTGNWAVQSPLHEIPGYSSEMLAEAVFMIELGLLTYDDILDVVNWETIATSETALGSEIRGAIFNGGVNVPADYQWTPTFYTTSPEPNACILLLIGVAFLALRRKRT